MFLKTFLIPFSSQRAKTEAVLCVLMLVYYYYYVLPSESIILRDFKQDAQLSQRDRAAGCVTVFAKSRRVELGDNILRTL